ncbi:unnamed protein product, partial [Amoebophrya sp. A120]
PAGKAEGGGGQDRDESVDQVQQTAKERNNTAVPSAQSETFQQSPEPLFQLKKVVKRTRRKKASPLNVASPPGLSRKENCEQATKSVTNKAADEEFSAGEAEQKKEEKIAATITNQSETNQTHEKLDRVASPELGDRAEQVSVELKKEGHIPAEKNLIEIVDQAGVQVTSSEGPEASSPSSNTGNCPSDAHVDQA